MVICGSFTLRRTLTLSTLRTLTRSFTLSTKNKLIEFDNTFVRKNLDNKNLLVPKANYPFKGKPNLFKLFVQFPKSSF